MISYYNGNRNVHRTKLLTIRGVRRLSPLTTKRYLPSLSTSLHFPPISLPSAPPLVLSSPTVHSILLRNWPLNPAMSEQRCKLPYSGLGQIPSRYSVWCILKGKTHLAAIIIWEYKKNPHLHLSQNSQYFVC